MPEEDSSGQFGMHRRTALKTFGALGAAGVAGATLPGSAAGKGRFGPSWTREQAEQIRRTDANTAPLIDEPVDKLSDSLYIWDTWPLRNRDGSITKINGYQVIFSLTAPNDVPPGARHNLARIRYFYSKNGHDWTLGGEAFENPLGHHQWAGSAMYDQTEDQLYLFYTAVSDGNLPPRERYRQRLAFAKGASMETSSEGVSLTGSFEHHKIAEADGQTYQTLEQSVDQGIVYAFRDPWYFQHPETGEDYVVFEGNTRIEDPSAYQNDWYKWNGNVGIAQATNEELTDWELQEPLLEAITTNQQLERPHIVVNRGNYYLFTISHKFTFAPGLTGPDGLYGFVADSMDGDYQPLNDGGLVVANPTEQPFQTYSHLALPHGDNLLVTSFLNFQDLPGESLDSVSELSPEEQKAVFGGTLAPSLRVQLKGSETRISAELQGGQFLPSAGKSKSGGNGKN
ncbi:glycoside hydrolase family 68 protein [Halococcus salsus]|uniref:glycoside hydrolase family 68 protein n=1 Tax=Halococcus salsus TaxID=2162894 RepID=UPI00135CA0AB|nr:glycoside hydrolase family 68 protein [Halococcus salsus]